MSRIYFCVACIFLFLGIGCIAWEQVYELCQMVFFNKIAISIVFVALGISATVNYMNSDSIVIHKTGTQFQQNLELAKETSARGFDVKLKIEKDK